MIEKAIVAFIDILGYGNIVRDCKNETELVKSLENLMIKTSQMFKKIKDRAIDNKEAETYRNKIIDNIKVKYISDTFLFTLQPITLRDDKLERNDNVLMCMWLYFQFISMLCPRIIGKTGFILKGGISIDSHYENEFDGNLFIFSKAYNNAYNAQRKETARIVIDDKLLSYLQNTAYLTEYPRFFYEDGDKKLCFDFYCLLRSDDESKRVICDIKNGILANIRKYKNDSEAMRKLKYFVGYHNKKIKELKFDDLVISIS